MMSSPSSSSVLYADSSAGSGYAPQPFTVVVLSGRGPDGRCMTAWLTSPDHTYGPATGLVYRTQKAVPSSATTLYVDYVGQVDLGQSTVPPSPLPTPLPSGARPDVAYTAFVLAAPGYHVAVPSLPSPDLRIGERVLPEGEFVMRPLSAYTTQVYVTDVNTGQAVQGGPPQIGP